MIVKIDQDNPDGERQLLCPGTLRHTIDGALNFIWLTSQDRTLAEVRRRAVELFDETILWWRRQDPASASVNVAAGLNLEQTPFSLDWIRLPLRNAVTTCWALLPEHRKQDSEIERVLRRILHGSLDTMAQDARMLDHPAAEPET